jgi:hypothetical protein
MLKRKEKDLQLQALFLSLILAFVVLGFKSNIFFPFSENLDLDIPVVK